MAIQWAMSNHLTSNCLVIKEYQDKIGFKDKSELNKSEWVYDVEGGGDYIEAAVSSLGISDEQLLQNLAPRLSKKIKNTPTVPWPPRIGHLEEGEQLCEVRLKLLTWLKQPERKTADLSPATQSGLHDPVPHYSLDSTLPLLSTWA